MSLRSEAVEKTANQVDLVQRARLDAKLEELSQDDVIIALTNAIRSVRASHIASDMNAMVAGAFFFAKHATELAIDRAYERLLKEQNDELSKQAVGEQAGSGEGGNVGQPDPD